MLVMDNFTSEGGKSIHKVAGYYVMPRYDVNLEEYFKLQSKIDLVTVLKITK